MSDDNRQLNGIAAGNLSSAASNVSSKKFGEDFAKENVTKSNAINIPSISLPKGGGAIKGIDEKFRVNAANGTAAYSIPLPVTPGRNAFDPKLSLEYDSIKGNGAFGLGWDISPNAIQRRTDKKLPRYRDGANEDIFMLSETEDLVPFLDESNAGWIVNEKKVQGFSIRRYRPRVESAFAKIERINDVNLGVYWKVTTKENVATIYGRRKENRIADPEAESKIFKWLPEISYDDKGNWIIYQYKEDSNLSQPARDLIPAALHEKNRKNGTAVFINRYLKRIYYGNKIPYYVNDPDTFNPPDPVDTTHLFELVFDYGEHDQDSPSVNEVNGQHWNYRDDAFSNYKAGFEIRTARLCKRILMFHHFEGEQQADGSPFGNDYLVRSIDLNYVPSSINNSGLSEVTYLESATASGYVRKPDKSYSKKSLPPVSFSYQHVNWNTEIVEVSGENLANVPVGLMHPYQWADLYGEGISGIFTEQGGNLYYKSNNGADEDGNPQFGPSEVVAPKPSISGFNEGLLELQDLEANGERQIVVNIPGSEGYFQLTENNSYDPFQPFLQTAHIDPRDQNLRRFDLDGDGKSEQVITNHNLFTWYASQGKKGYAAPEFSMMPIDDEEKVVNGFKESVQRIFLADMSGDGMVDYLMIDNGVIWYHPAKGYGKFGKKISMANAPWFDTPDQFNPAYIHLADISGTGATDIIYTGKGKCVAYLNLSGNGWSDGFEIKTFPPENQRGQVAVIDLLGNGTPCLVWSSDLPGDARSPMRYIDLMSSKKPHVMIKHVNNMGLETTLEYKSSTWFYLRDKAEGKPWITRLPFPVQVVYTSTIEDTVTNVKFTTRYTYHHGYFDHTEREFRGFGRVDQYDTEEYEAWKKNKAGTTLDNTEPLFQKPVMTRTWFHIGVFTGKDVILKQFESEYWYNQIQQIGITPAFVEPQLPDAIVTPVSSIKNKNVIDLLTADEWREALRACKGMVLRQEVFAMDAPKQASKNELKLQFTPYSVTGHNCHIQLIQPRGEGPYAVFLPTESEAIHIYYERDEKDPRISHTLNVVTDELGNVTEQASVVYPRLNPDTSLPESAQTAQATLSLVYSKSNFTNDVIETDSVYRLRVRAEASTFEIKGLGKKNDLYVLFELKDILVDANSTLLPYEQVDNGAPVAGSKPSRRLIEHVRTIYATDKLDAFLPLYRLESLGLVYQSYQLAYTPGLLSNIFSAKTDTTALEKLMKDGKYVHSIDEAGAEDGDWWVPSGITLYKTAAENSNDAQKRFYSPIAYVDPFGSKTIVRYYKDYFILVAQTEDQLGNKITVDKFNFRAPAPQRIRDVNNNLSEIISDELGLVKASAVMGKGNEADTMAAIMEFTDAAELKLINEFFTAPGSTQLIASAKLLLGQATSRLVYNLNQKPVVAAMIMREEHFAKNNASPVQVSFEYTDGMGKVAMKKVQAEPGMALQIAINNDNTYTVKNIDTTPGLRWISDGRIVRNNKGLEVKVYEKYFSASWRYEDQKELVETGVTPFMYYDPVGRLIRTMLPDGTLVRKEYGSWMQLSYDANDTVLDDECSWYKDRINENINTELIAAGKDPVKEKEAANASAKHANTPTKTHLDTLERVVLLEEHNKDYVTGANEFYQTQVILDIEGNVRSIIDPRGNTVMSYKYDMLGHRVYQDGSDSGQRWTISNVLGDPLSLWDERDHQLSYFYDELHRFSFSKVSGGDGTKALDNIFERVFYGEGLLQLNRANEAALQAINVLGKEIKHFDTGGALFTPEYDFKGKPVSTNQKLFKKYKETSNWIDANLQTDLEDEDYLFVTETDALVRITKQTSPDGSIFKPSYNEAGLLNSEIVEHKTPAITATYIKDIDYNEKGQRNKIIYGNNIFSKFYYDKYTFRLIRLETRRKDNLLLQDLYYTYDATGNITHIEDKVNAVEFFKNQEVSAVMKYGYDALYRLKEGSGRENNVDPVFDTLDNYNDRPFILSIKTGDRVVPQPYTQTYSYDESGNITQVTHAGGTGWTREYHYENKTNRIKDISIKQGGANFTFAYPHHPQHGFIMSMPHLVELGWNFKEELIKSIPQKVNPGNGTPETSFYQYNAKGQRTRKITENFAADESDPTLKDERIYIGNYEIYKKHSGPDAGLVRISLGLADGDHRFALIETRNNIDDGTEERLVRYQLDNHLGSVSLELDGNEADPQVISYEEYHPYGTTAYQLINNKIKSAAKRYRYSGLERDEETGFGYHSARYYVPWLGRWLSCDQTGITDGCNLYQYAKANPLSYRDLNGNTSEFVETFASIEEGYARLKEIANSSAEVEYGLAKNLSTGQLGLVMGGSNSVSFSEGFVGLAHTHVGQGSTASQADLEYVVRHSQSEHRIFASEIQEASESILKYSKEEGLIRQFSYLQGKFVSGIIFNVKEKVQTPIGEFFKPVENFGPDKLQQITESAETAAKAAAKAAGEIEPVAQQSKWTRFANFAKSAATRTGQVVGKGVKIAGQALTLYGASNVSDRVYRETGGRLISSAAAFVGAIAAGAVDDAIIAVPAASGNFGPAAVVLDQWDRSGAGPTQTAVGEAIINYNKWGARVFGKWW